MPTLLLYGVIALAIIGTLGGIGYKIHHAGYVEGTTEIQEKWDAANAKARAKEAEASAKAAKELEDERAKSKIVYRTITRQVDKIIDRPVYRNVCLDPDGLRCANAALLGKSAVGCDPDKPVPAAKPSG